MNPNEWLEGHRKLLKPPFARMSQEERLLRAVMMAYAKHHLGSEHIGWDALGDVLMCEICNTIGDDAFVAWSEKISEEAGHVEMDRE